MLALNVVKVRKRYTGLLYDVLSGRCKGAALPNGVGAEEHRRPGGRAHADLRRLVQQVLTRGTGGTMRAIFVRAADLECQTIAVPRSSIR